MAAIAQDQNGKMIIPLQNFRQCSLGQVGNFDTPNLSQSGAHGGHENTILGVEGPSLWLAVSNPASFKPIESGLQKNPGLCSNRLLLVYSPCTRSLATISEGTHWGRV